jgi:hypothetical protein
VPTLDRRNTVTTVTRFDQQEMPDMDRRECAHQPHCPDADARDHAAAHMVATHPEQGWSLLCNGVVLFEDTGELMPDGSTVPPHRPTDIPAHAA